MAARSRGGSQTPARGAGLDRLEKVLERFKDELKADLSNIQEQVERTDARVDITARAASDDLRREIAHINTRFDRATEGWQRGLEQVRQELRDHEAMTAKGAAKGAAEGVTASVAPMVTAAVESRAKKLNGPQWFAVVAMSALLLSNVAEKAPGVLKMLEALWKALTGLSK